MGNATFQFGSVQQILCSSVFQEYPQRDWKDDGKEITLNRLKIHLIKGNILHVN